MRFVIWTRRPEFIQRKRWRLRFLEVKRRRRFRLAELARDPLELHLSAFRGPLA
jgi:hypothetical protein